MAHNALFHLFQEQTSPFTVVTVSDKTNHRVLQTMTDIPEMIKALDIHKEVIDIHEMTLKTNQQL